MSRTYIGPFGRILPLPEGYNKQQAERELSVASVPDSRMTTYRLPRLPVPSPSLQFGTDTTLGLTEPMRYGTTNTSRRPLEPFKSGSQEQLPSVNQLLTPGSLSSVATSPYAQSTSSSSPVNSGPDQPSPRRGSISESFARTNPQPFHSGYSVGSFPQHQYAPPSRDIMSVETSAPNGQIPQYFSSYHNRTEYDSPSYPPTLNSSYRGYATTQTTNLLAAQVQSYHVPSSNYDSGGSSGSLPSQSGQDMSTTKKPLLRVVAEETIPGEGLCYIYSDGSHLRKTIDGETVNAHWGVTKAGKARKRLAVACMTCREKKIKCEPGEPKCVQCDKSGRECRFQTAPRGQNARSKSPSYELQARTPSSISARTESHFDSLRSPFTEMTDPRKSPMFLSRSPSIDAKSFKRPPNSPSPAEPTTSLSKRLRQRSPDFIYKIDTLAPKTIEDDISFVEEKVSVFSRDNKLTVVRPLGFEWENDPYPINPTLVLHYINLYFTHINSATYRMFPTKPFLRWLQYERDKSPEELMVVYSMLAMGSVFSSRPEQLAEGTHFSKVSHYAVGANHQRFSLQLAQSRLLLALYHFSVGESTIAWDYEGLACRAIAGLKNDFEQSVVDNDNKRLFDYGLNKHGLVECYRRTYWSAFLMDRFRGLGSGHFGILHAEDAFARLPCDDEMYENQEETSTPYFDNGIVDSQLSNPQEKSTLGRMAYLVQIACIWDDVLAYVYRSAHRSRESYRTEYDRFYHDTYARLDSWCSSLPSHLVFNQANLFINLRDGNVGFFISIHSLFHLCFMTLNRHILHEDFSIDSVRHHVHEAFNHALQLLHMMEILSKSTCETRKPSTSRCMQPDFHQHQLPTFSTPFPGYAILIAIDILGATGSLESELFSETLRVMNEGLKIVIQLSRFWSSAKSQRMSIMRRIEDIANRVIDFGPESGMKAWVVGSSMEKMVGPEQDVFYNSRDRNSMGEDEIRLFGLFGLDIEEDEVMFVYEGTSRRSSVVSDGCGFEDDVY